ncbi:MAG: NTP transferase domain-containing protein [Elusimicrobia bacterium]|nr:NTP transferase domain-containing protein [Elusimicrobiota bacterium]
MKAMVLAAGVGSRLKPLTDAKPKALIEIGGKTMLEIVIRRLIAAGVDEAIVNVFHFPDQIADFLNGRKNFGIRIELSRETELLDTGGGLKNAAAFFADGKPFLLHNVDVFSEVDLTKLYKRHLENKALATLSVRSRKSSRMFLFDKTGTLCGWESKNEGKLEWAKGPVAGAERLAFDGIHVVSPAIFTKMTETGVFSITKAYLRLASAGETIRAFRADDYFWQDAGGLGKLEEIRRRAEEHGLPA